MPKETSPPSHPLPLPEVLRKNAAKVVRHSTPRYKQGKLIGYNVPVRTLEQLEYALKRMEERDGRYNSERRGIPR